jgi:hypothetical protein
MLLFLQSHFMYISVGSFESFNTMNIGLPCYDNIILMFQMTMLLQSEWLNFCTNMPTTDSMLT